MNSKSVKNPKSPKIEEFKNLFKIEKNKLSLKPEIKLSNNYGVYIFFLSKEINRLRGKTDILYIGVATSGLRNRINRYLNPDKKQKTNFRIKKFFEKLLSGGESINLLFIECCNKEEAKKLEDELLKKFEEDHWELPPFNRQGES